VKIYTKRGDAGETDLFGGLRVSKDDARVEAYGAVDELNAVVGLAAAMTGCDDLRGALHDIQSALFDLGSYLAAPDARRREKGGLGGVTGEDVASLERRIDALEAELAPLQRFILPGGTPASAALHLAR